MQPSLMQEVLAGLQSSPPFISPKFFYDELGSKLFEAITLLDEYYPTRVEKSIMQLYAQDIANAVHGCDVLIDLGAGNCAKASELFDTIKPTKYKAIDISKEFLELALIDLQKRFPKIEMESQICDLSGLLIGVDLEKDDKILNNAYDDSLGVTAAFNLNVLRHINRVISSNFNASNWQHYAIFNKAQSRIEMYLRALQDIEIIWPNGMQRFKAGDLIHTENSYKYTKASFTEMLRDAGFKNIHTWTDANEYFLVCYASAKA